MYDLGRSVTDQMKSSDKRTMTVDMLTDVLGGSKKYGFLTGSKEYDESLKAAEDGEEADKERTRKAREKREKDKEDEDEDDGKAKSKKTKGKGKEKK